MTNLFIKKPTFIINRSCLGAVPVCGRAHGLVPRPSCRPPRKPPLIINKSLKFVILVISPLKFVIRVISPLKFVIRVISPLKYVIRVIRTKSQVEASARLPPSAI